VKAEQRRYVKIAPKTLVVVGSLAGTKQPHGFIPDAWTGSSCLACFATCDAVQHPYLTVDLGHRPKRRHAKVA